MSKLLVSPLPLGTFCLSSAVRMDGKVILAVGLQDRLTYYDIRGVGVAIVNSEIMLHPARVIEYFPLQLDTVAAL